MYFVLKVSTKDVPSVSGGKHYVYNGVTICVTSLDRPVQLVIE